MADWRTIGNTTLIDMESIKQIDANLYEIWTKATQNDNMLIGIKNKHGINGKYALTQTLIDIASKRALIKNILIYGYNGQLIYNLEDMATSDQLDWFDIAPDCVADIAYNIITGKYTPPKQANYNCFWFFVLFFASIYIIFALFS